MTTTEEQLEELQEEKAAIPLELFFDLVFVFAITQVVSLIAHDLTAAGIFHGALVLAILWWGWGVWTWTTNTIDLEPRVYRAVMLASMVPIFIMAQAVPFAFDGRGWWLALGYLTVRLLASVLMYVGSRHDEALRRGFLTYMPMSSVGPIAILIGAWIGGEQQQWWWVAGVVLELMSAVAAGRADWAVDAGHFAERHGLIMIIALGEAIIVVGSSVVDEEPSASLALLLGVGLAGACALWWAYFDRMEAVWETALRDADNHETGHVARDIYSVLHYPMIVGIVLYAVALEEAFKHPDEPLEPVVKGVFVAAMALYLLSMAAATFRAYREKLYERTIGVAAIALIVVVWSDGSAKDVVLVSTIVLIVTMTAEYFRYRSRIRGTHQPEPVDA